MENIISILISSIILDLLASILAKEIFKLKIGLFQLSLTQIVLVLPTILYLFLPLTVWQFIIIKLFMWFIFVLLVTDSYYFKNIFSLFFLQVLIMFSIYGVAVFLLTFLKAMLIELWGMQIENYLNFILIFLLCFYFVAIFSLASFLSKTKSIRTFLSKVSFSVFGKHIEITGLLDSGNSLYDSKTGKAVIVVSVSALKKVLPKEQYQKFMYGDMSAVPVSHFISYVSVGGKTADMPIIDVGSATVKVKSGSKQFQCVIGLVNHSLDNSGGFECLLHRDFV